MGFLEAQSRNSSEPSRFIGHDDHYCVTILRLLGARVTPRDLHAPVAGVGGIVPSAQDKGLCQRLLSVDYAKKALLEILQLL